MAFFCLNWYRTERQMYILTTSKTYILIGHVPVRPLTVGHHLPHDNAIAPDITGGGELAVLDGFRGSPADGDFAALRSRQKATRMQWDKDYLWKQHHWNNQMLVAQHNPEHGVTVPLILPWNTAGLNSYYVQGFHLVLQTSINGKRESCLLAATNPMILYCHSFALQHLKVAYSKILLSHNHLEI